MLVVPRRLDARAAVRGCRGPEVELVAGLGGWGLAGAGGDLRVLLPDVEGGWSEEAGGGADLLQGHVQGWVVMSQGNQRCRSGGRRVRAQGHRLGDVGRVANHSG
ncbi:hypothetical protein B1218_38315, partial [Pseudomonas ogarae]